MTRMRPMILGLLALGILMLPGMASAAGFMPIWQEGDSWTIEARYRDLTKTEEAWLPPVRWDFSVRNRKSVDGVPCFVVHVTPADRSDLQVQAVLCLAESDLRMIRAVDVFPRRGQVEQSRRSADENRLAPLLRNGSMIPYDMPMFPLDAGDGNEVANAARIGAEKSTAVGSLTFVEDISQEWESLPGDGIRVILTNPVSDGQITQVWRKGLPWAESMTSHAVTYTLVK